MSTTPYRILALATIGLLAVGGLATAVAAEPGEGKSGSPADRREAMKERMESRSAERDDRRQDMRDAHESWQDCKRSARGNASMNESRQHACMAEKSFFLNATHAVREARAGYGAVAALERQIGRLEVRELALKARLESGNLSGNETEASIQERIAKIDAAQERLAEKLAKIESRIEGLHEKWQAVRDHKADRRDHDDEDDIEESIAESSSESSSASSSSSAPA